VNEKGTKEHHGPGLTVIKFSACENQIVGLRTLGVLLFHQTQ
jgi:hypothetical protein